MALKDNSKSGHARGFTLNALMVTFGHSPLGSWSDCWSLVSTNVDDAPGMNDDDDDLPIDAGTQFSMWCFLVHACFFDVFLQPYAAHQWSLAGVAAPTLIFFSSRSPPHRRPAWAFPSFPWLIDNFFGVSLHLLNRSVTSSSHWETAVCCSSFSFAACMYFTFKAIASA